MLFNLPISQLIRMRFSCRTYSTTPIDSSLITALEKSIKNLLKSPFGNSINFRIVAAREGDSQDLNGLGTYGFIWNPGGFIIGSCKDQPEALIDFGYLMEILILYATNLGLGSCWLGGTLTKSRFAKKMNLKEGEIIPSAVSIGYPADQKSWLDRISRIYIGADQRQPWENLFFQESFGNPLSPDDAGIFKESLEMVRLAPSASNRQPWRVVKAGDNWHFYLQRTPNYRNSVFNRLLDIADLQQVDLGIAMSHFDLSAQEKNLRGKWITQNPNISLQDNLTEYTATWIAIPNAS